MAIEQQLIPAVCTCEAIDKHSSYLLPTDVDTYKHTHTHRTSAVTDYTHENVSEMIFSLVTIFR